MIFLYRNYDRSNKRVLKISKNFTILIKIFTFQSNIYWKPTPATSLNAKDVGSK